MSRYGLLLNKDTVDTEAPPKTFQKVTIAGITVLGVVTFIPIQMIILTNTNDFLKIIMILKEKDWKRSLGKYTDMNNITSSLYIHFSNFNSKQSYRITMPILVKELPEIKKGSGFSIYPFLFKEITAINRVVELQATKITI